MAAKRKSYDDMRNMVTAADKNEKLIVGGENPSAISHHYQRRLNSTNIDNQFKSLRRNYLLGIESAHAEDNNKIPRGNANILPPRK